MAEYHTEYKLEEDKRSSISLKRSAHVTYLTRGLGYLHGNYQGLDASQPWIVYWILNSLDLLGKVPDAGEDVLMKNGKVLPSTLSDAVKFLSSCVDR